MNSPPFVSIIVRTKDRPKLLKRALQSIAGQTYRPIEVVLVNDGGCDLEVDELKGILRNIGFQYIRLEKNMGRAHAGNVGIEHTYGDYIGFLDDDDEFYPEHVFTLASFLVQSDYEVAYTDSLMVYREYNPRTHEMNDSVEREVVFSQEFNYDKLVFENYIPFMCLLFKRATLVSNGGFDTRFELYEDWDLLIRIGKNNPFYHLKQVTADYNQWSIDLQISQRNRDIAFLQQAYMAVISRHIEEVTPKRIQGIIAEFARTRQTLKDLKNEIESQKTRMRVYDAQIEALASGDKAKDAQLSAYTTELQEKAAGLEELNSALRNRDALIEALASDDKAKDAQLSAYAAELQEKAAGLEELNSALRNRDDQLKSLISLRAKKDEEIVSLHNAIQDRDALIIAMKNTRGWRILEKYRRVRDEVIAPLFGMRRGNTGK